jgi:hypothetical protein
MIFFWVVLYHTTQKHYEFFLIVFRWFRFKNDHPFLIWNFRLMFYQIWPNSNHVQNLLKWLFLKHIKYHKIVQNWFFFEKKKKKPSKLLQICSNLIELVIFKTNKISQKNAQIWLTWFLFLKIIIIWLNWFFFFFKVHKIGKFSSN